MSKTTMTPDEILLKVTKEMDLCSTDMDMLEHDVRNLRGDEWLNDVKASCSPSTYKAFRGLVKNAGKLYI